MCLLRSISSFGRIFNDSARLWPRARAEVQAFVGLLPAIVGSWTHGILTLGARTTFSVQHRLGFDSHGSGKPPIGTSIISPAAPSFSIRSTKSVPLEVVEASGWMEVASGRWRYRKENIIVLESRALTRRVEILASTQQLYQKRCVALVDNVAVALSFERLRSRNFLVLTCIRKLASLPCS